MGLPLVTLQEYKTYKKLTKTEADVELQFIIDSINVLVKTYLGHSLIDYYTVAKVEYFSILDQQLALQLNEWPVSTVSLVEYKTSEGFSILDTADYYTDKVTDSIFMCGPLVYWPKGYGSVRVTYTAGYPATPADIKLACLDLVHHYYKEEYKERKQIGGTSIDNSTRSGRGQAQPVWPPHITRVLDLYRNVQ